MTLTTLAVHVEPGPLAEVDEAIALPLAIAGSFSAHVTALVFRALWAAGADHLSEAEAVAQETAVAEHLENLFTARGASFEVRGRSSFAYGGGQVLADQLRVSDLGAMTYPAGGNIGSRQLAVGGLFSSGRPLVLMPAGRRGSPDLARILVAWDASPAAVRAIHGAMPLLRQASLVTVVSVTDDKEFRPGQSGIELTHLLARHGARAEFRPVQRQGGAVSRAILDVAAATGAGLLVMGAVRHTPISALVFGSATMDLLDRGPGLPTLLAG